MDKKIKNALLELSEFVDNELFPIELVADYVGELCMKAGDEKPYKVTELTYEQLFNLAGSLQSSIKNVKRVMEECINSGNVPIKE